MSSELFITLRWCYCVSVGNLNLKLRLLLKISTFFLYSRFLPPISLISLRWNIKHVLYVYKFLYVHTRKKTFLRYHISSYPILQTQKIDILKTLIYLLFCLRRSSARIYFRYEHTSLKTKIFIDYLTYLFQITNLTRTGIIDN